MFLPRDALAMAYYESLRQSGQKHSVAVKETIEAMRQNFSDLKISRSGLQRIRNRCQPKGLPYVWRFCFKTQAEVDQAAEFFRALGVEQTWVRQASVTLSIGPRPEYRRHNAKL